MKEEIFEIVDETGKVIGKEKRSVVHAKGLIHRASDVFVLDKDCGIFIQQRSFNKDVCPGLWDLSAAEHLLPGETYEEAAVRGLKEELGVKPVGLQKIGKSEHKVNQGNTKDHEKKEVFKCRFEGKIKRQKEEVEQGKFISKKELLREMRENPKKFTPWFLQEREFIELL